MGIPLSQASLVAGLAAVVRYHITRADLNNPILRQRLALSSDTWRSRFNGTSQWRISELERLAPSLGISVSELFAEAETSLAREATK